MLTAAVIGFGLLMVSCASTGPVPVEKVTAISAQPVIPAPTPLAEQPLRRTPTRHIVLSVAGEDGQSMDFVLDSGASSSVISTATRDRLGLPEANSAPGFAAGAGGSLSNVTLATVPRLAVGDLELRNHTVAVMDKIMPGSVEDVDGVLGQNFFAACEVELDFARGRVKLYDPGTLDADKLIARGMVEVEMRRLPVGLVTLEADLVVGSAAGQPVSAILDLGAQATIINRQAAALAGIQLPEGASQPSTKIARGVDDRGTPCYGRRIEGLRIGDIEFGARAIQVCDLPVFNLVGLGDSPAMLLGFDVLDERTVVILGKEQLLYISAVSTSSDRAASPTQQP
ncbi:MAG: aspartyl protease family protein [Myxococcota bacterium]